MSRVSWNLLRFVTDFSFFPPALAVEIYGRRLSLSVFIESETPRFIKFAEMSTRSNVKYKRHFLSSFVSPTIA